MKILMLLLVVALSGCAMCPQKEHQVVVQEVKVPVAVRCKVGKPPPLEEVPSLSTTTSLYERSVLLIKELEAHRARSKELEAALTECADFK